MKAIVALNQAEHDRLSEIAQSLLVKIRSIPEGKKAFDYGRHQGYAHYTFVGNYTEDLVTALGRHPTEDEIIILVDGGFSHFGADCRVDTKAKTFSDKVYTD